MTLAAPASTDLYLELEPRLQVLQETDFFSRFEDLESLEEIAHCLDEIHLPADYPILLPGDPVNQLYILAKGKVRLHAGPVTLAQLSRGACFGKLALEQPQRCTIAITTVSACQCLVLKQAQVAELLAAQSPFRPLSPLNQKVYQTGSRQSHLTLSSIASR